MNPLLRLYPRDWRERYGDEMSLILAERRPGPADVLDLFLGAIDARLRARHRSQRSGSEVPVTARLGPPRIGALGAIAGGVLWIATVLLSVLARGSTGDTWSLWLVLLLVASTSLLVALLGLDVTGDGRRTRLRWWSVLLPTIGIVLTLVGGIGFLMVGEGPFIAGLVSWAFWAPGVVLLLLGSALFGTVVAIDDGPLRWRGALLQVGALIQLFGLVGTDLANDDVTLALLGAALFGAGWIALGLPPHRIPRATGPLAPLPLVPSPDAAVLGTGDPGPRVAGVIEPGR